MTGANASLRLYLTVTALLHPVAPLILKRRLARGKEDPARWREKLGQPGRERPKGRLVWMHAVGLGETLALRGLIDQMAQDRPDQEFLVTSGTRTSAEVLERNMPPRTRHQFLPLDTPQAARRFLDHWRPDLAVWAEQELWPGLVYQTDRRGIPLALVNARMDRASFDKRRKARAIYADALSRFRLISAQDADTAHHLSALGAQAQVAVDGSLKPAAPPLSASEADLDAMRRVIAGRPVFLAASTHAEDEAILAAALPHLPSEFCIVIVPRDPGRVGALLDQAPTQYRRYTDVIPTSENGGLTVLVDDRFGTLGAWYRLARTVLIGGSFGVVEGHNPWEAAALDCAILHGPRTANFRSDYKALDKVQGAIEVTDATALVAAIQAPDPTDRVAAARRVVAGQVQKVAALGQRLNRL